MKTLMKVGMVITSLASLQTQSQAESTTDQDPFEMECRLSVFSTYCGNGEITFSAKYGEFSLNYGDIRCWMADVKFGGILKSDPEVDKKRIAYPGKTVLFKLQATKSHYGPVADLDIGVMEFDPDKRVLHLDLNKEHFGAARGSQYYLKCDSKKPPAPDPHDPFNCCPSDGCPTGQVCKAIPNWGCHSRCVKSPSGIDLPHGDW